MRIEVLPGLRVAVERLRFLVGITAYEIRRVEDAGLVERLGYALRALESAVTLLEGEIADIARATWEDDVTLEIATPAGLVEHSRGG